MHYRKTNELLLSLNRTKTLLEYTITWYIVENGRDWGTGGSELPHTEVRLLEKYYAITAIYRIRPLLCQVIQYPIKTQRYNGHQIN